MAESKAFSDYFGDLSGLGIIEILEYPYISEHACKLKIQATKAQNLKVAIDDFGDGLSNMDLVKLMSPDIVKLDRSLISNIDKDKKKQEDVKKLVLEFHERGIQVVAEGVERKEEYEYLLGLGVDFYQGYYFAMPE